MAECRKSVMKTRGYRGGIRSLELPKGNLVATQILAKLRILFEKK